MQEIPSVEEDQPRPQGQAQGQAQAQQQPGSPTEGANPFAGIGSPEELMQLAQALQQGPQALANMNPQQLQQLQALAQLHAAAQAQAQAQSQRQLPRELQALRQHPMFATMRQLVRQNPQLLQPALAQLAQSNPQLVMAIRENPDAFLQMLSEGEGGGPPPGTIQVTPEEKEAIDRLCALGFDRNIVVQVRIIISSLS